MNSAELWYFKNQQASERRSFHWGTLYWQLSHLSPQWGVLMRYHPLISSSPSSYFETGVYPCHPTSLLPLNLLLHSPTTPLQWDFVAKVASSTFATKSLTHWTIFKAYKSGHNSPVLIHSYKWSPFQSVLAACFIQWLLSCISAWAISCVTERLVRTCK